MEYRRGSNVGDLSNHPQQKDIRLVLVALFTAGVIVSIIGVLQTLTGFDYISQAAKPASTFGNKNMAMHFIVLTVPVGVYFLFTNTWALWQKCLVAVGLALMLAYTAYSSTGAAWLSLLVELSIFLALLFYYRFSGRSLQLGKTDWIALTVGSVVLLVLLSSYKGGLAASSLIITAGIGNIVQEAGNSSYIRYEIWRSSLNAALQHWFLGVGLNNYD